VRHVTWTIERIETLSQYRHDGLSAAQVSHRMGSFRSSVLGIIKCTGTETAAIRRKVDAAKAAEQEASARALVAEFVVGAFE
jgi:hypothetical protein